MRSRTVDLRDARLPRRERSFFGSLARGFWPRAPLGIAALHLVTSPYAAAEARGNLARKRPGAIARFEALLHRVEVTGAACLVHDGHGLPPKDVPILAAAVASGCQVLLTGDIADFGHVIGQSLQGVRILTASLLLAEADLPPA